jgi:hypothetical protein
MRSESDEGNVVVSEGSEESVVVKRWMMRMENRVR